MKRLIIVDDSERPDTYYIIEVLKRRLQESLNLEDPYDPDFAEDAYLDMYQEEEKMKLLTAIEEFTQGND